MLLLALLPLAVAVQSPDPRIRSNTVGFLPESPKVATVAAPCEAFTVVRVDDGKVVFQAQASAPVETPAAETGETVQTLDFSALKEPGTYQLVVPKVGASQPFTVAANVWNEPYEVVTRAMYLWRCGTEVSATWRGRTFSHAPCHLEDGWLDYVGGGHTQRKSIGGWHDAGDYNKYPVNAGVSVGYMLKAWEHFGARLGGISLGIPESKNAVPDILDEIRFEVEWLLTMQQPDGTVYHKLSALDFSYWGPSEKDASARYFAPWSTTATADFAAMLAGTARAWRPYDAAFADRCLAAAELSWTVLEQHPTHVDPDLKAFKTGTYKAKDGSHRLWAAAELWETTGHAKYLRAFETLAADFKVSRNGPTWGDVHDLGFGTYVLSAREGRTAELLNRVKQEFVTQADAIVVTSRANAYGRPLGGARAAWYWGANGTVAGQTFLLNVAGRVTSKPEYRLAGQHALNFLFGRNFHGRSYVTGLGGNPPEHPHDRRGEPTWPGYLVGGGHPTGRDWVDKMASYSQNEIAINWNTALIYATASMVE